MFRDILLTIDLAAPQSQKRAVDAAVALARQFGANLHVINVVPEFGLPYVSGFFPQGYEKQALAAADQTLHAFVRANIPSDIAVQHIVGHGTVYREILHFADETGCDLIVMASHRPDLQDYLLGPNAAKVVRHANQSVLVVRG